MEAMNFVNEYDISKHPKENRKTPTNSSKEEVVKKCVRKGNMICIANAENISMPDHGLTRTSRKSNGKMHVIKSSIADPMQNSDEVLSGESLYKTYIFEQSTNDAETDKCIAFWKSVMEKNLKPIKCTIIENSKNRRVSGSTKDETIVSNEKNEKNGRDNQKNEAVKIHEEYRKMWLTALNEIKKKKLHEIELVGRSRCKMCEILTLPQKEDSCTIDKGVILKEIQELNDWQPKSKGKGWSRKVDSKQKINQAPASQYNTEGENTTITAEIEGGIAEEKADRNQKEKKVARDSKTYKYTNIIEEKKKTGAYSEWRQNKLKSPCTCEYPVCDCNTNPALISVERIQSGPNSDSTSLKGTQENDMFDGRNFEETHSAAQNGPPESVLSDERLQENETDLPDRSMKEKVSILSDWSRRKASSRGSRILSLMLRCPCGRSSCDCLETKEYMSKIVLPEFKEFVQVPANQRMTGRVSTASSMRGSVHINDKVVTHLVSSESLDAEKQEASDIEAETSLDKTRPTETLPPEGLFTRSLTKVDSVEVIRRRLSSIDAAQFVPPVVKEEADAEKTTNEDNRKSLTKVDSVEVIRRKLSSMSAPKL